MMKPVRPVGIAGYGAYVPRYRIAAKEIARVWDAQGGVPVEAKSVPGPDEDTITMSVEAARNALQRGRIEAGALSAVWVGSESHPYSVKPSGTIVAEALGATPWVSAADWEFACKAGSEALTAAMGMVGSSMAEYVLAIGADTAQGRPGDALEYTAAAGAAALLVGPADQALATIEATVS
jgi:hydroxymethylglutaryl-CoA synthase